MIIKLKVSLTFLFFLTLEDWISGMKVPYASGPVGTLISSNILIYIYIYISIYPTDERISELRFMHPATIQSRMKNNVIHGYLL